MEGTPKTVRNIDISGNTYIRDQVIRRQVSLQPGKPLDITQFERTRRRLKELRYFQEGQRRSQVRTELVPVCGHPDLVDVAIRVTEGDWGSFVWGMGVNSATGVRCTFQFHKGSFPAGSSIRLESAR